MRFIQSIILVGIFIFVAVVPCMSKSPTRTIEGVATKVTDGDTIIVTDALGTRIKVRFYGMDAPETAKPNKPGQPYGEEAYHALLSKLNRQQVRLDVMDTDRYGRAVCIVWLGNRNINVEMVLEGWAWAYKQYLDRPYASQYLLAEEQARKAHKGLWQQANPQPPGDFRKSLKKGVSVISR